MVQLIESDKMGYKNSPFCSFCEAIILGVWIALWSAVVFVVSVTIVTVMLLYRISR